MKLGTLGNVHSIAAESLADEPNSCLKVCLLGPPRVMCNGSQIGLGISTRALLLFARLVTSKEDTLERDEIAFALWPDHAETDARTALRRHIYQLQRALPPSPGRWLSCNTRTIGWAPASETWVDVNEFERLSNSPDTLELAAALYRGDFMPNIDHEWVASTRERLRRKAHFVFDQAATQRRVAGDLSGALYYLEQLLAHDPWREDAIRKLMLTRYRVGDRAGALAHYRSFSARLRSEFEVDPMPETTACFQTIAQGLPPADC